MNYEEALEYAKSYMTLNSMPIESKETTECIRELGCDGCAFESVEEWEMPCCKCKQGCKDYYRRPREES